MGADWALPSSPFLSLSSLALSAPHRRGVFASNLYPSLVSAPTWLQRFDLLQVLGEPDEEGGAMGGYGGNSHRVVCEAYGSTGCVNAMDWAPDGRLASAGDDTKICIWKPGLDGHVSGDGQAVKTPMPGYGLSEVIATGHRSNIFSVKWAPGMDTRLFSCAGDGVVRVFDINLATNPKLSSVTIDPPSGSPYRPWTHHESATACTHAFRCHQDRVKRVATEASPDIFLTCAEDGTVRQHDLRMHHVCRKSRFDESSDVNCPPPLAEYPGLSLYSLTISKLRPHLFVVAGQSPYAFLHDRRMIRAPMLRDWGISPSTSSRDLTQCVRRFGVPLSDPSSSPPSSPGDASPTAAATAHRRRRVTDISQHIVACKLSPTRPRDLLVSYSERGIFLFDTDGETVEQVRERSLADRAGERAQMRSRDKVGGAVPSETSKRADQPEELAKGRTTAKRKVNAPDEIALASLSDDDLDRELAEHPYPPVEVEDDDTAEAGVHISRAGQEDEIGEDFGAYEASLASGDAMMAEDGGEGSTEDQVEEDDPDDDGDDDDMEGDSEEEDPDREEGGEIGDDDSPFQPRAREGKYHTEVPLVAPRRHYTGHANTQTVKDVNFLDPDTVISGSDDGNFFCWDRETAEIKGIWKGDDDVVNVMQPHPRLPLVAISGIEETVKLFGPTTDTAAADRANLVRDVERIRRRNLSGETNANSRMGMGSIGAETLMQLIRQRMLAEFGDETGGARGGEGEGPPRRGPPIRLVFGGEEGEEGGQPVECVVS
ncbi:hypothetical protein Rhopal_005967-T1 [Rhodotorula paludigena]|uniref:WD40 repeat-like protein n=1 Tax=Rhodotorula paludigena TaxID=86838 RepID=A0AAV5GSK5_9BASI|nr:hypothetical protein Rhopal_005967-T1 [Rhodotorula paludigena]